jgi:preprotein translocase subunit SecG
MTEKMFMDILTLFLILIFIFLPFYIGWYAYKEGKQAGIKEEKERMK